MMGDYGLRLACFCLASFFAVQLAAGLFLRLVARWLAPAAERMSPRVAVRVLLAMRCAPMALGLFVMVAVCVPSYLWFEPGDTVEELGAACVAAAVLGAAVLTMSLLHGIRQVITSRRCVREFGNRPVIAITGFLRPRLFISPIVKEALSAEQLDAAMLHERAHVAAQDNLKRLLLAFTPGLLPGVNGFAAIERRWARLTEWAADDDAVAGDPDRALALAAALVRVARLGAVAAPLTSSILDMDGDDLTQRVDRLLHPVEPVRRRGSAVAASMAAVVMMALIAFVLRPATLESAHDLLERLVK
jgi:Zn-dependent protease with chaperone function